MASVARFDTWQAADGTNVARFSGGELQVWDGAAWVAPVSFANIDYLVVAGGGGSGGGQAGIVFPYGGGGGEVVEDSLEASGIFTVTVGAGGVGNNSQSSVPGTSGGYSEFHPLVSNFGQGGYFGRGGTSGSGFAGASRSGTTGGAGGGAGGNATSTNVGGIGVSSSITGSAVGYGGGGSGTSGSASDGGGVNAAAPSNRGGGGAGGQNGGSGIVYLSIPTANTVEVSAGLTFTYSAVSGKNLYSFTSGTGTVTVS